MIKLIATILLSAFFSSSTTAVVSWEQPPGVPLTCLRIYHVGAQYPAGICYENLSAGPMSVELPGALTHPAYQPQPGDKLVLAFGMEDVGWATLGESVVYETYLALVAKQNAPERVERVYLAAVRGG